MASTALQENNSIKTLKFERIPLSPKIIRQFSEGIKATKSLRELSFASCRLTQEHLQAIKTSLAENESLITLDLSGNQLCQVGGMIGHILSEHSRRRSEMIWMLNLRGEMPVEDSTIPVQAGSDIFCQIDPKYLISFIKNLENKGDFHPSINNIFSSHFQLPFSQYDLGCWSLDDRTHTPNFERRLESFFCVQGCVRKMIVDDLYVKIEGMNIKNIQNKNNLNQAELESRYKVTIPNISSIKLIMFF